MQKELIENWAELSCREEDCLAASEVENLTKAMALACQYKKEMRTPLLTVGIIQDFHREVLRNDQRAGELRDCHVQTSFNFETHHYPAPHLIETQLASTCDVANRKITNCIIPKDFIKTAAWIAYNILSLHPFHDGNGRTVRVVVAFLLLEIQCPAVIKNWVEPIVKIRKSVSPHHYFPIECNVTPLLERIQQSYGV